MHLGEFGDGASAFGRSGAGFRRYAGLAPCTCNWMPVATMPNIDRTDSSGAVRDSVPDGTITSSVSVRSRIAYNLARTSRDLGATAERPAVIEICSQGIHSAIVTRSTIAGSPATLRGRPVHSRVKITSAVCGTASAITAENRRPMSERRPTRTSRRPSSTASVPVSLTSPRYRSGVRRSWGARSEPEQSSARLLDCSAPVGPNPSRRAAPVWPGGAVVEDSRQRCCRPELFEVNGDPCRSFACSGRRKRRERRWQGR